MSPLWVLVLFLGTFIQNCAAVGNATAFLDAFSSVSTCAQQCVLTEIPLSVCETVLNTTCICTDAPLKAATQACVLSSCNVTDALALAKAQATACEDPVRNVRDKLYAPMSVELIGVICIFLRLFSRWRYAARYEVDDWIMVVCTPIFLAFEVIGQYVGQRGFGVDLWEIEPAVFTFNLKLFYIDEAFYLIVLTLTKLALLFCYLRIFPQHTFRRVCYVVITWVTLSGIVFLFLQIFQCVPLEYIWEGWLGTWKSAHTCLDVHILAYTAAAMSIAQDVVILIIPMPMLGGLQTSIKLKAEVCVMFSLGFFILLTSCIRLNFIVKFANTTNPSWDYSDALIWTGLEGAVSMIVVSLPAIRTLLRSPESRAGTGANSKHTRGLSYSTGAGASNSRSRQYSGSGAKWAVFNNDARPIQLDSDESNEIELGLQRSERSSWPTGTWPPKFI